MLGLHDSEPCTLVPCFHAADGLATPSQLYFRVLRWQCRVQGPWFNWPRVGAVFPEHACFRTTLSAPCTGHDKCMNLSQHHVQGTISA